MEDTSTAQEEADDAQLKLVQSHVKKDVDHWGKHLTRIREHEDSQRYSKRTHSRTQDKRVERAATERQESHDPVRAFRGDQGVSAWISACIQSWSDTILVQTSDIYILYWLDLSKVGSMFKKILLGMLRIIGDAAAQKARQVCGVVVAPLVSSRGAGTDADAADEAHHDCEAQIKMDIYKLAHRRITFSFEASAKHQGTWCSQPGRILYSNMIDMKACALSDFTVSRLCCQRGVVDLPLLQEKRFRETHKQRRHRTWQSVQIATASPEAFWPRVLQQDSEGLVG
jgi:hypothetical protein